MAEHSGETVYFKEPILLKSGILVRQARLKGHNLLTSTIPAIVPKQKLDRNGIVQTEMAIGQAVIASPTGFVVVEIDLGDGGETTITVPNSNVSYIGQDKDFPQES